MRKINMYIFLEVIKGCSLVFFIFLSVAWLLQFTRLISLTNLIQVDIMTILYLSLFLVPNLLTIIMPFAVIFGLIITFLKLHKDRELISIYSLGLNINSVKKPLILFSIILVIILIIFNFYLSPRIYKEYKIKEYEIRNQVNFEKIIVSNFIELNKNTYLDFKKDKGEFKEVFIKFLDKKDNMIFAKQAKILQMNNLFKFKLTNGFKITIIEDDKIEKLEFDNYSLDIVNESYREYDNFDNNTFDIVEDFENKNYNNIIYKIFDSFIILVIILFFYNYNIKLYFLNINNLLLFVFFSSIILILNQIHKNFEINIYVYFLIIFFIILSQFIKNFIYKRNV